MLLRVIISPANIRKISISEPLASLDYLKEFLQSRLELKAGFSLQYEDPEFGNELCNLTDILELPKEKATLKVLYDACPGFEGSDTSVSSLDTTSLYSSSDSPSTSQDPLNSQRSRQWPSPFLIPTFSYDVELRLKKGNEEYNTSKIPLDVTRDMKNDILDKIAQAVFSVTAYPTKHEVDSVAMALICKHPCLSEPGAGEGWLGWRQSISFKIGNYRTKLRNAGCKEVTVNTRKECAEGGRYSLKKPRRSEVNFLPENPSGLSDESLEQERVAVRAEMEKKSPNVNIVNSSMERTFSLRRKEIVEREPSVGLLRDRWPALFLEHQICSEFERITAVNLRMQFHCALDIYAQKLLKMYRVKRRASGESMQMLLDKLDEQTSDIVMHRKTAALRGLPLFLREVHANTVLRTCLTTDDEEKYTKDVKVAILTVLEDDGGAQCSPPDVVSFAIVLEENVVVEGISDLPSAFLLLFGLFYALNIEYPKEMRYSFEVIQKVLLGLGTNFSARVLSFKNKLLIS
ncbi:sterile alpha motif domain-containing protein 3-like [Brachyhypopomus gauderio]|uniref:sterile alpha motif domain-containing protein 3-like n=1 Tax=Brachyhypopomus gauderio TaxID=698409 RepID=UPI0040435E9F